MQFTYSIKLLKKGLGNLISNVIYNYIILHILYNNNYIIILNNVIEMDSLIMKTLINNK